MGNLEIRSRIWDAITADDAETLRKIMKKYPEYLDRPISSDRKSNAVTRAAYLDRPHILALLQSLGADLSQSGESGINGLMWASAKGNLDSIKFLISAGVNMNQTGPYSMNAADFGLLFGTYKSVFYLNEQGCKPSKSCEEFKKIREQMKTPNVNFNELLRALDQRVQPRQPLFVNGRGNVEDPNETIGSWIIRTSEPDLFENLGNRHQDLRSQERGRQNETIREFDLD